MLRDLRYVILFVEDLERSLEFYLRKVGLEVRFRAEGYAELGVDGPKLALLERWRVPEIVGSGEARVASARRARGGGGVRRGGCGRPSTASSAPGAWHSSARPPTDPGASGRPTSRTLTGISWKSPRS